jgi:hypothetical protein
LVVALRGAIQGIPIADDMTKGTYFVASNGAVMLDSPNVVGRLTQVAPAIGAFASFEVRDTPPDERHQVPADPTFRERL